MKNFFKGLSFSQILAGTLAAVTSFLLAAKIGLAGSVIGVAVGSAVSAIATQLYQNVLRASTKKIKDVAPFNAADRQDHDETALSDTTDTVAASDAATTGAAADAAAATADTVVQPPVSARVVRGQARGVSSTGAAPSTMSSSPKGTATHSGASSPAHPSSVQLAKRGAGKAKPGQHEHHKRMALVVAIVSGLAAVLITAGVVLLATRGEGTDDVVRNFVGNSQVTPSTPTEKSEPTVPEPTSTESSSSPSSSEPSPSTSTSTDSDPTDSATTSPSPSESTSSPSPSPTTTSGGTGTGSTSGSSNGGTSSTTSPTSTSSSTSDR